MFLFSSRNANLLLVLLQYRVGRLPTPARLAWKLAEAWSLMGWDGALEQFSSKSGKLEPQRLCSTEGWRLAMLTHAVSQMLIIPETTCDSLQALRRRCRCRRATADDDMAFYHISYPF
ncbi:uncharacterized protein BDZ83DRAFT_598178 [Colletotrichum acutatum]|uniref:Uncharacterized protein n=1 Tax=Glomerella acutata TaxID=27357 RepID=A0AAD9D3F1_GLOAC|nr:uncharacterized protein BDZ83DRAFT_598178 [Colletotrichum acutatum]KAK1731635.1 hypothetical protein BDZ83DRAFT_598178 [Colletotrichum acutatum]